MRILWVCARPIWPARGGSELRVSGLAREAVTRGHHITLLQPDPADPADAPEGIATVTIPRTWTGKARVIGKLPSSIPLHSPRIGREGRALVESAVESARPDVIVVSETHSWPLARHLVGRFPMVHDSHNVETDLMAGMKASASGAQRIAFGIDLNRVRKLEATILRECAVTVAASDADAAGLARMCPTADIVVAPSSVELPAIATTPGQSGKVILFVGQLDFPPNTLAVHRLIEDVFPRVLHAVPDAELVVVGRRPPKAMRDAISRSPGVRLAADVPAVEPYYRECRLTAMPIATGSGSRLKVFEALSYGIPIVASTIAVSGIPLTPGADYVRADAPDEMADAVCQLLSDSSAAAALGAAGRARFESDLGWTHSGDMLETALNKARD